MMFARPTAKKRGSNINGDSASDINKPESRLSESSSAQVFRSRYDFYLWYVILTLPVILNSKNNAGKKVIQTLPPKRRAFQKTCFSKFSRANLLYIIKQFSFKC